MSRLSHRDLCKCTARWLLDQYAIDLVTFEMKYSRGIIDVLGISSRPSIKYRKAVAIEVKRTRSDLLADLRKSKMLKYERRASHCILAATSKALRAHKLSDKEVLEDLKTKGLPTRWGVLILPDNPRGTPRVLRRAKRIRKPQKRTMRKLTRRIARSYMYRILSDKSPVEIKD